MIRDVLEGLSPDELLRSAGNRPATGEAVTVTWVLDHILAHTGEHVGHIQITRHWWEKTKE